MTSVLYMNASSRDHGFITFDRKKKPFQLIDVTLLKEKSLRKGHQDNISL
jgi:hypothetical protein